MRATRWLTLMSAVLLAACGGDGGTGPGNGGPAFVADVSGDLVATLQGDAMFGEFVDPEAGPAFALEMAEPDRSSGGVIQIIRIGAGIPATGTYQLTDAIKGTPVEGSWVAAAYDTDEGQVTGLFAATSGSVTVTSVSQNAYKGTFSFVAEGGLLEDPETTLTITVSGRFTASPAAFGQVLRSSVTAIRRTR